MLIEKRLEVLTKLYNLGSKIIELHGIGEDGYCTCKLGSKCPFQGKHPVKKGWQKNYITSLKELEEILKRRPYANFGILTGDGLLVIDVDKKGNGLETLEKIKHLFVPTLTVKTGGGGYHFYYKTDEDISGTIRIMQGIDIRCKGNYVVAPTSKHKSGSYYEIVEEGK